MTESTIQRIDLDAIVRSRAGKKARYIPGFVLGFLKKLVHQSFINGFLEKGYTGVEFCGNCLDYLDVKVVVEGLENIPDKTLYVRLQSSSWCNRRGHARNGFGKAL